MNLKLAWLRARLLAPSRQIRWKIIAPYAILTLVLAASGTFLATRMVTGGHPARSELYVRAHLGFERTVVHKRHERAVPRLHGAHCHVPASHDHRVQRHLRLLQHGRLRRR